MTEVSPAPVQAHSNTADDHEQHAYAHDRSTSSPIASEPKSTQHTASRVTSTASNLPPLPDDSADFSLATTSDHPPADDSALLDHHVKHKLMDIESSFMPDGSPAGHPTAKGADDTYLFGGSPGRTAHLSKTPAIEEEGESDAQDDNTGSGADLENSQETSAYSTLPSSPAANAMKRNMGRAVGAGARQNHVDTAPRILIDQSTRDDDQDSSPPADSNSETTSNNGGFKSPPLRKNRRPAFLQNRASSQRSSVSSTTGRSDLSGGTDLTVGADFALQSGGAVPRESVTSHPSLSRLPSLASIASSLKSSHSDTAPEFFRTRSSTSTTGMTIDTGLGRLEEEGPSTPRAGSHGALAPSDTVIARHVRDIHVPETIAREYREKYSTRSPERRHAIGLSYSTRSKNNLTLKEQNSKIDKLSKENFDLKLKIHFLDQALQNRSEEGVKEMISKSVQLQTDLANEKKDNSSLRRKIRDLERKLKTYEEKSAKPTDTEDEESGSGDEEKAEMEEEITYLRETVHYMESEVERLKEENMNKEVEKRRLAEYVKTMGERRLSETPSGVEETNEMWKELLQAETARREAADEDAQKLREELQRIKSEQASVTNHHNVRNVYNITRRNNTSYTNRSDAGYPETAPSNENRTESQASTVVDQLQTDNIELRSENAELRRDLSAQTSMLTSRNRERERLQQEIEELKLQTRRGLDGARSIAGDSIFDRSVSRAHQRSSSRASGTTRLTQTSDPEKDEIEKKLNTLRDENAQYKMLNQDLETALNEHLDAVEALEGELQKLREERELTLEDLQALQQERDDLLVSIQDKDTDFENLRAEAVDNIDKLEEELEQKSADFNALQAEYKSVSEQAVLLEDDLNASKRKEETLKQQLEESEREIEELEQKLRDTTEKNERLDVQLENSQNEIAFLREEQEGDKIKISEIEASLSAAQTQIDDMLAQAALERRQREALDSEEKAQIQAAMDELNQQVAAHKEEVRKLRKKLGDKENEAETWKERLETLESNLREALGDLNGTRSSLLKDVTKLQRDLEHTLSALEISRQDLSDRERTLRARDTLLESAGLETKKLSEMLDKERQARRTDRATFEAMQRSQQSLTRTLTQNDTRVSEIEAARHADRRKFAALEVQLKEQLTERNNLLFSVWNRLATLCGREFAQKNPLGGDDSSTSDFIAKNLPSFSRNITVALKHLETIISSFRKSIRDIERTFTKELQNMERALDHRTKRIDHLEKTMQATRQTEERIIIEDRSASRASSRSAREEQFMKLKSENKLLKAEVQVLLNPSPSRNSNVPERHSSTRGRRESTMMRHYSASAVEGVAETRQHARSPVSLDPTVTVPSPSQIPMPSPASPTSQRGPRSPHPGTPLVRPATSATSMQPSEQRWVHRLKELERRLKAEREARLLDRSGARKRIEESEAEKQSLRLQLEREIERRQSLEEAGRPEGLEGD